ncbi:sucrose transport protein [Ophiocordyceps camponoti-floridani]|uniref:Sucrose transport protein n=1 Tax=Ophiocordyceps camponoti-floridani TaxID=2030778 RepID=A0A8H4Q0Z2_9HYPO|nr:sucrose transport protein [Ophiocordyceps camponoti-floridani]
MARHVLVGEASVRGSSEAVQMMLLSFAAVGITIVWGVELTYCTPMAAIGHVIGYAAGSIDLVSLLGPSLGTAQFQQLTILAAISILASTSLTCCAVTERVLISSRKSRSATDLVRHIYRTIRHLRPRVQAICWAQFWAWIGWFPFLFYSTTWVGETYYRYDAGEKQPSEDGVGDMGRIGSLSLFIYSALTFIAAFVLPILVRSPEEERFTPRPWPVVARLLKAVGDARPDLVTAWMYGHVVFAAAMVFAPLARSFRFATLLMCLCSLPWAMATWAPSALLGVEVNKMSGAYRPLAGDVELRPMDNPDQETDQEDEDNQDQPPLPNLEANPNPLPIPKP